MILALKKEFEKTFPVFYKFIQFIVHQVPSNVEFWDKKKYRVTRKIKTFFKPWKQIPGLIEEANSAFENYQGGDFIDIGAFHGFYSFLLAPKANKFDNFISCEPDFKAQKDLLENLSILNNVFKKIKFSLINSPINTGKETFLMKTDYGHPTFIEIDNNVNINKSSKKIKSTCVDDLVKTLSLNPKFIKIDVEGAEFDVLQGMTVTFEKYKPLIHLEKHPTLIPENISLEQIDNLLKKNNYILFKKISSDDVGIKELWKFDNKNY